MDQWSQKDIAGQFSKIGWGMFAFLVISLVVQLAVLTATRILYPDLLRESWYTMLAGTLPMYGLGLPVAAGIIKSIPQSRMVPGREMTASEFGVAFCMTMGLCYTGNLIGNALMLGIQRFLGRGISNPLGELLESSGTGLQIFILLVAAPLLEEFLFRGCIVSALRSYSPAGAVLVSGLAFGLCHGNLYQFFYAFILGLLFAYIYLKSGRLFYTICLHFLVNLLGGVIPLLLRDWTGEIQAILSRTGELLPLLQALGEMRFKFLAILLYNLAMWGLALSGILLCFIKRKDFRLGSTSPSVPAGQVFQTAFVNGGMLLFLITGFFLFVCNLFL